MKSARVLGDEILSSNSSCVSVRAADDKKNAKYEPIINLHELVEVGLDDRIRNARVRAFERTSCSLHSSARLHRFIK